ncbi:MAG: hypothetical protein A2231_01900 [Candidatus Firestonebacteria bacterium RIFOXYA2_FULL_40_8]|nr:MAG: hypothetical protein A2231_01900 [Candidatus Firestonebacteria bacterium RIFOXYA2_FULL_40_8]
MKKAVLFFVVVVFLVMSLEPMFGYTNGQCTDAAEEAIAAGLVALATCGSAYAVPTLWSGLGCAVAGGYFLYKEQKMERICNRINDEYE